MTRILTINPVQPDAEAIREAADACRAGAAIVFPTDTIYGLGTDAANAGAVERLYETKGRPISRAMPLLIGDAEQLFAVAGEVTDTVRRLANAFWPGALTLVVPGRPEFAHVAAPGGAIGVRLPGHVVPREIASRLGRPIVGTSANRSGESPPPDPAKIADVLGAGVALVLDAGPLPASRGSTVLDVTQTRLRVLRQGDITLDRLRAVIPEAEFATE